MKAFTIYDLRPTRGGVWQRFALVLLVCVYVLGAGCLSRPPLAKEYFLISAPAFDAANKAAQPRINEVLALGNVSVATEFEGRSLIYRLSENTYELDAYAEFLVPPDRMLAGGARNWLRSTGLFREISEPGSAIRGTRTAELHVSELYADFRSRDDATAVFTLRFVLVGKRTAGAEPGIALSKAYSRRVKLKERNAAAVVAGLQQAFGEVLEELGKDIGALATER